MSHSTKLKYTREELNLAAKYSPLKKEDLEAAKAKIDESSSKLTAEAAKPAGSITGTPVSITKPPPPLPSTPSSSTSTTTSDTPPVSSLPAATTTYSFQRDKKGQSVLDQVLVKLGRQAEVAAAASRLKSAISQAEQAVTTTPKQGEPSPVVEKRPVGRPPGSGSSSSTGGGGGAGDKGGTTPQVGTPRTRRTDVFNEPKMKCLQCNRERKVSVARTDKFCTQRCITLWKDANPGKDPDQAGKTGEVY